MLYIILTVIIIMILIALIASFIEGRHEYILAREEVDRAREEKNILIEFLHKTAEDVGSGANKDKLYHRIVRATALSCGAMSACVYEKSPEGKLVSKAIEGLFPPQSKKIEKKDSWSLRSKYLEEALQDEEIEMSEGIIGEVAVSSKPILIKDATKDPRIIKHEDESLKVKSIIAVPMIFRDNLYGVLAIANHISDKPFTETELSLARSLGEQAALSLYNIETVSDLILKNKLKSDLRLASSVQHYLLPKIPESTDLLEFAVKYTPQQLIGGDFYDFFNLADGKIGVVIGDVSGKGISAAIVMAICQSKLRYIAKDNKSPSKTLQILNAEMVVSMRTDMFITMIYAIIDIEKSQITLARAGHEQALLYSDGETKKIQSSGMAVGMVDSEIFDLVIEDTTFDFNKGDIFTLYTDGITEAVNAEGEEYTTNRLAKAIEVLSSRSASDINNEIIRDVASFAGNTPNADDLTLVCIKR